MRQLLERPIIKRLTQAWARYTRRHGPEHAAAITYFSVLTLVPVLMLAGAIAGFVLTVLRPDLLSALNTGITSGLGGSVLAEGAVSILRSAINGWQGLAIVALLAAVYSGSNWVGNLRFGFCAMLRPDGAEDETKQGFFKDLLRNFLVFLGLLACLLLSASSAAIGFSWIGSDGIIGWLLRLLLTFLVSWLLFTFLFLSLPERRLPARYWVAGALGGALMVTLLHQFAGLLIGAFASNPTALVFGPVIVTMVVLNLIAVIMLLCSAWTGERVAADPELTPARTQPMEQTSAQETPGTTEPSVPINVAAQGIRAGMKTGYGLGTVTGLGIGAAVTALVTRFRRRG
jgi:ribonuclease